MDFQFTEEQKKLRTKVREFLEREIAPVADERDKQGSLSKEEVIAFTKKLMPLGYYVARLPKEYGGLGFDCKTHGILWEEGCRVWVGLTACIDSGSFIADILGLASDELREKLKEKYFDRIRAGELIACSANTEPNAGSDLQRLQTKAVLDGDEYVIDGTKIWITLGNISDIVTVLAITDKGKGPKGISMILVDREDSPFQAMEIGHLGWLATPTAEMSFDECRVPKTNMIGSPEGGYAGQMQIFERARSTMAVMSTGMSQGAIDASIKYAQQRVQFGKPIGSFQMIQEMIADMIAETEASRLLAYRAFDLIDKGIRARKESSLAKLYATEASVRVTSKAIQIHGANGLSHKYPVARFFRDARMMTIPDGATQIQKLIVGREFIGIKAFA